METRVKNLETVTARLARRSVKVSTGLITPYPISKVVFGDDIQGVVLNYMFPCDGEIIKGSARLDKKPKGSINLTIELFNEYSSISKGFMLNRLVTHTDLNISIKSGDCLKAILTTSPGHPVTELWLALLWKPTIRDVEAKSFLIDKLDEGVESERV